MLLSICTGLELTFYSGVYGTCLGAMTQFGEGAKGLIGLSGILIGVGEILGKSVTTIVLLFSVSMAKQNVTRLFLCLTRRGTIWDHG